MHDQDHDPHTHEHETGLSSNRSGVTGFWDYLRAGDETRLALIGGLLIVLAFGAALIGSAVLADALLLGGMALAGWPIARGGINTLLTHRTYSINLLMTIAALGAVLIGELWEGAVVVVLFAIGEALEGYTAERARSSIRSLLSIKPKNALRLRDSREEVIAAAALQIGDMALVKPGEAIPADGIVISGMSGVNQAPVTGESIPVVKAEGDEVFAGTINGDGMLHMRVTRLAEDNTVSRIIQLVEEAQRVRAPSQRQIDRFASVYTPAVTLLAAAVAVVPPLLFGAPFYDTAEGHGWLYRALSLLVIACPCALVISTPVTVISAMTGAARRGVLIKGGVFLEALGTLKAVAFDKTGTLTEGKPSVTHCLASDCPTGEPCSVCDDVLALASAVERRTAHPLAQAVVGAAEAKNLDEVYAPAEQVEVIAGRGVRGQVDGRTVTVGSHDYFEREFPHSEAMCAWARDLERSGQTTMLVAEGEAVRGGIALADTVRPDSRKIVAELGNLGLQTVMLTGDHPAAAQSVAAQTGVTDVWAGLLPQGKLEAIRVIEAQTGPVAMVGDGINDAPALAAATVGIAMGGAGSPQALETADVALMADDLSGLPFAVRLSRYAREIIRQNVILSFGMKAAFVALALGGVTSLWLAIFADVGMSLIVTLNGMRPLRTRT